MDKVATTVPEQDEIRSRRLTYKSIKRMTFGCKTGSQTDRWVGAGPTTSSDHNNVTVSRQSSVQGDCEPEATLPAEKLHSPAGRTAQTGNSTHRESPGCSELTAVTALSNKLPGASTADSEPFPRRARETDVASADAATGSRSSRKKTGNEAVVGATNNELKEKSPDKLRQEAAAVCECKRVSTVVKTVQLYGDKEGRCLKPLLEPIQDAVRTHLLEYSHSHFPREAHQHITNEVIIDFDNGKLNITININYTMFTGDRGQNFVQNTAAQDDVTGATEELNN